MKYKIQLINNFGEIVDESAELLSAEEAIALIYAVRLGVSAVSEMLVFCIELSNKVFNGR